MTLFSRNLTIYSRAKNSLQARAGLPSAHVVLNDKVLIICKQGDIVDEHCQAITNGANSKLQLGEGIAGSIRKRAGPLVQ